MALTIETALQITLSLVAALGGMWMRTLQGDIKELERDMQLIRDHYQRRDDAHREFEQIMVLLQRIEQKLDKKADK